jgi:hypothetical protein
MDRRRQSRTATTFPVRVWGVDSKGQAFLETVSAKNLTEEGAMIMGMPRILRPGDTLQLQYDARVTTFTIVWIGNPASRMGGQVGLMRGTCEAPGWTDLKLRRCAAAAQS